MARKIVTVCHSLKIIPVDLIIRFAELGSKVIMKYFISEHQIPDVVPGTVIMQTGIDDEGYARNIDFEITEVNPDTADTLSLLRTQPVVATYRDESGNPRVCGSPDYPLTLEYHDEGGVYKASLSGKSPGPDGFLQL